MKKQCNSCGSTMQTEIIPFSCDLTGIQYETAFGKCDCTNKDLIGKKMGYEKLSDSIRNKLEELDELERKCVALGLGDKIAGARHVLDLEIKSFLDKKESRINSGHKKPHNFSWGF